MLKKKIMDGEVTIGSWITIGDPSIAEILVNAGYDWLVVDLEHSTISLEQAGNLIRIIDLGGTAPLVRITNNNPNQIKRVLDAGAYGIIIPMINSESEAKAAVAATRYGPDGIRGVGLARAQGYGATFQEYHKLQKENETGPIVIVQIEHIDAVANLESILSVKGVDAFFIGPYDLSCSMGIPGDFENPAFLKIMTKIFKVGEKMRTTSGVHLVEPDIDKLKEYINTGYKFIAYSVDIRMLDTTARAGINSIRGN